MEEKPVLVRPDSRLWTELSLGLKIFTWIQKKKKKKWLLFFVSQKDMTGLRMFFLVPETMSTSLTSNNKYHYVTGFSLSSA